VGDADRHFWSGWSWVAIVALGCWFCHLVYSLLRDVANVVLPVDYHTWNETPRNDLTASTPSKTRWWHFRHRHDPSDTTGNAVYAPAPRSVRLAGPVNAGADLPAAPANAPRWAENPNTHASDYWLLPRAKWACVSYAALAVSCIVAVCMFQVILANHDDYAAQGRAPPGIAPMGLDSERSRMLSTISLLLLLSMLTTLYTIMPPRTTLVKNGILTEPRRASMSHQAPTRLGDEAFQEPRFVETV